MLHKTVAHLTSNSTVCSDVKHTAFSVKPKPTSFSYDQRAKILNSEYEAQSTQYHSIKAVLYINIQTCSSPSYSQEDPQNISCFTACLTAISCSCAALKIGNADVKLKELFEVMTKALIAFFHREGYYFSFLNFNIGEWSLETHKWGCPKS